MLTGHFILKKSFPDHQIGEYLFWSEHGTFWEHGVQHQISSEMIQNAEWFEPIELDWIIGEPCWFITLNGMVVSDYYKPDTHSSLARYGNLFKSEEGAIKVNQEIRNLLTQKKDQKNSDPFNLKNHEK